MPASNLQTPVELRLETSHPALIELAQRTRRRLGVQQQDHADWVLRFDDAGVELLGPGDGDGRGVRAATRRPSRGSRHQPFARALGRRRVRITDATGGLGEDALLMFALGHDVTVIERSPVVCALLEGAAIMGRFPFPVRFGDARQLLAATRPDVVYLDPMFPPKRGSALAPRASRYLAAVVGADPDAAALLAVAREIATDRVVVKRPDHAASLAPGARSQHQGKVVRYDVYAPAGNEQDRAVHV